MEGVQSRIISQVKRILCYAYLLTTHTPSAKGPTLNLYLSVRFGRACFADQRNNCTKHSHRAYFVVVMLFLWLLQRTGEMVVSVVLNVLWPGLSRSCLAIFRQVMVLAYKMFTIVVADIKIEYQRDAIVEDQRDMNIAEVADSVDDVNLIVCGKSSISQTVGLFEVKENTCVSLCTSECYGDEKLDTKDGDSKLASLNVEDSYLNGCVENCKEHVRSRHCIFVSGRLKRSTRLQRHNYRSREPSRICSRLKVVMQKKKKTRRLFQRRVSSAVPKTSILYEFKKSSFRKENLYLKYFVRISVRKNEKKNKINGNASKCRKRVLLKNGCRVFKNKNHQSLQKKMKLFNDIESNPGPVFIDECTTIRGTFHQGNEQLFGMNAGKQCVGNSLVAIIFNAASSCFTERWDSSKMDSILHLGNGLYSYIRSLLSEDLLLLSEIPTAVSLDDKTYRLFYSESITGDVNMVESRDCYFSLFEALRSVKTEYNACLLTIFCNTVAIFFSENKLKLFDAHSRDNRGNTCSEGTSVLLEFSGLETLVRGTLGASEHRNTAKNIT